MQNGWEKRLTDQGKLIIQGNSAHWRERPNADVPGFYLNIKDCGGYPDNLIQNLSEFLEISAARTEELLTRVYNRLVEDWFRYCEQQAGLIFYGDDPDQEYYPPELGYFLMFAGRSDGWMAVDHSSFTAPRTGKLNKHDSHKVRKFCKKIGQRADILSELHYVIGTACDMYLSEQAPCGAD